MNATQIKMAIKAFHESKTPYTIMMDNGFLYTNGGTASMIIWNLDKGLGMCIRTNAGNDQMDRPIETAFIDIDHISELRAMHKNRSICGVALASIGRTDTINVVNEFLNQDAFYPTITGSVGDGIKWAAEVAGKQGLSSDMPGIESGKVRNDGTILSYEDDDQKE